ncbi:MAG TPA: rod shape-determining protein [Candidatus Polarisedimenticolia bacterium]|nr:rod shape-determining protein [Candidatus Polarisedimenticolia bacterium]
MTLSASSVSSLLRRLVGGADVAIDLGTANSRVFAQGIGLVADEPSVVPPEPPVDRARDQAVYPLRSGVVADVQATSRLLRPWIARVRGTSLRAPRVLVCTPTDASEDERAALVEATRTAGAASVALLPEPLAAAVGAGLDISSPYAQMVVDIGEGVTDIAVIASGSIVGSSAVRTACGEMHEAVGSMLLARHDLAVGRSETERLLREVGVAEPTASDPARVVVRGRDATTGHARWATIDRRELLSVSQPVAYHILNALRAALRELPPSAGCEVIEGGIHLTGGGALVRGMRELIAFETRLTVHVVKDPMHAVIDGARQMLAVGAATGLWKR